MKTMSKKCIYYYTKMDIAIVVLTIDWSVLMRSVGVLPREYQYATARIGCQDGVGMWRC